MTPQKKITFDRVLLLGTGVVVGLLIAVAVYSNDHGPKPSTSPDNAQSAAADQAENSLASHVVSANPPPLNDPPNQHSPLAQTASTSANSNGWTTANAPAPAVDASTPATSPEVSQQSPWSGAQNTGPTPIVVTGNALQALASGAQIVPTGGETQQTPSDNWNPNWYITRNGLIGNPPVDPGTSHGRAYATGAQF